MKVLRRVWCCTNSAVACPVPGSTVLVSQRGNAEGIKEAEAAPRPGRYQGGGREKKSGSDREAGRSKIYRTSATSRYRSSSSSWCTEQIISRKEVEKKAEPCYLEEKPHTSKYISPSPQDPAKRAQLSVALLGDGAQLRECARGKRPGGSRGTRPATKACEKGRSRARDRRPTDPGLRQRR